MTLELRPDVVDLRRRPLPLEHAGADLDRVAHRLRRLVAGLGALANQLRGARVVDLQALDHQPIAKRAHRAVAGVVERELWSG